MVYCSYAHVEPVQNDPWYRLEDFLNLISDIQKMPFFHDRAAIRAKFNVENSLERVYPFDVNRRFPAAEKFIHFNNAAEASLKDILTVLDLPDIDWAKVSSPEIIQMYTKAKETFCSKTKCLYENIKEGFILDVYNRKEFEFVFNIKWNDEVICIKNEEPL